MSGYSQKKKQLLSAAGTIGKANFFRVYKPHCSINHATSYHHGNEQPVPIFLISLYMTTQYLSFHRGDISGIPGREPPAPGPASVANVLIQSSRDWRGMTILSWLESFSQAFKYSATGVSKLLLWGTKRAIAASLAGLHAYSSVYIYCTRILYSLWFFFFVTLRKCKPHS